MRPTDVPIGLLLARTAKAASRAFDDALAEAGGSLPTWLVLMTLMRKTEMTHGELAAQIGVRGPTLTHHLDALEESKLIHRERDTVNRRVQLVCLTEGGVAMFHRLRQAAQAHDARLRAGLAPEDLTAMRGLLMRLLRNIEQDRNGKEKSDDRRGQSRT
ncbi:MAG TPA: MarR family winged helix-turn-helix transcriptional regulator [Rhizobiaceae bacterium]|nr:MarR family winged helix-turn-helix transcriptional regulator [Rhizobiaceae bacterium]